MSVKIGSSLPTVFTSLSSPLQSNGTPKISSRIRLLDLQQRIHADDAKNIKWPFKLVHEELRTHGRFSKRRFALFATSEDQPQQPSDGRSGFISFYNRRYKGEDGTGVVSDRGKNEGNLLWVVGPTVLVASFIFPSLYLRRILATIFEDSLLTDFLILFFTEALFYCGVGSFLFLIDHFRRVPPTRELASSGNETYIAPPFGYRIFSAAALASSLTIPMVTMGFVWPWTGPAASATLAPYLVGIVVQFAFEQYARRVKSPSWPVIPIVFQVYRLHQLNRAAQLVTALSMTVRGAETTPHNSAINGSLGTLLNVLQLLGVICIWSLSSFVMRYFPSTATLPDGSGS